MRIQVRGTLYVLRVVGIGWGEKGKAVWDQER